MDPHDAAPRPLRRSDVAGVALVVAVAWISTITSHPRVSIVRPLWRWIARATAMAAAAAIRLYALGQTPLVLVVVAYTTALAVITAIRSAKHHPADFSSCLWWSIAMIMGLFTVACASTTDQQLTAAVVRGRVTYTSILEHLLLCAVATLGVLMWIHESHYAFASRQSWTRPLRRLVVDSLSRRDEKLSSSRARSFATLSGLMAACAVHNEKCVAVILRTWESDLASLPLLVLLATAWLVTTGLECYWWHHATLVDPLQAHPLLRSYLMAFMVIGVTNGAVFFNDIQPNHTVAAVVGLIAILLGLVHLKFHTPIEPKRGDTGQDARDDATRILLDATESLLDISSSMPASPSFQRDLESPRPPYRPPVHFRFA